ncbi:hypothetical protein HOL24_06060 [bacterium]|nr:hypothetical protein [bacterium]
MNNVIKTSLIYKNIWIYRLVMNFLYYGRYKKRFNDVIKYISLDEGSRVIEYCFGDLYIANYCFSNKISWVGYDINRSFIQNAKKNGFSAYFLNLLNQSSFSKIIDTNEKFNMAIIMGSLYHFHDNIENLINQIMSHCEKLLISEPISSLSNISGPVGWMAQKSANVGHGDEVFRYDKNTLIRDLERLCEKHYKLTVFKIEKDLICQIEWK